MLSAMISLPPGAAGRTFWQSAMLRPWNRMPYAPVNTWQTKSNHVILHTSIGSRTDASQSIAFNPLIPPTTCST